MNTEYVYIGSLENFKSLQNYKEKVPFREGTN